MTPIPLRRARAHYGSFADALLQRKVLDAEQLKAAADAANPALAMENIMKGQEAEIEFTSTEDSKDDAIDATVESAGEAPVIRMVNSMMIEALKTKASDIHFEALEKSSRLRYRIDGELVERPSPPKALHSAMEPFLMVFLGAIIGTIVMAMFMPIFNLGSLAN